jgi:hypothetical protein
MTHGQTLQGRLGSRPAPANRRPSQGRCRSDRYRRPTVCQTAATRAALRLAGRCVHPFHHRSPRNTRIHEAIVSPSPPRDPSIHDFLAGCRPGSKAGKQRQHTRRPRSARDAGRSSIGERHRRASSNRARLRWLSARWSPPPGKGASAGRRSKHLCQLAPGGRARLTRRVHVLAGFAHAVGGR